MLYVFDPTAMHTIVVKDQYVFEETRWFNKYVWQANTPAGLYISNTQVQYTEIWTWATGESW